MNQTTLTDSSFVDRSTDTESPPDPPTTPVSDHPAVSDIDITGMELDNPHDNQSSFPHPENINQLKDEDCPIHKIHNFSDLKEKVDNADDSSEVYHFFVFDAAKAYEYLETLQKQSDLYLENFHRSQLIITRLSQQRRGYSKSTKLSTYDKERICEWEVSRRLTNRDFDSWGDESKLTKENGGLPNAD
jgi:hypothetical protein